MISAVILAALFFFLWLRGFFLPRDLVWNRETVRQVPEEVRHILPAGSLVQDALYADITGDGEEEWVLLVWKRGSFGKHRPTWVERDSWDFSQHVFLYTTESSANTAAGRDSQSSSGVTDPNGGSVNEGKEWRPLWMSSALGKRVISIRCGEAIREDGRESIVLTDAGGKETRWGWITFGLMLLDEEK